MPILIIQFLEELAFYKKYLNRGDLKSWLKARGHIQSGVDEDTEFVKPGEERRLRGSPHCPLQLPENGKWRGAHLVLGHVGVPQSCTSN